jgi:hypothetical protein
MLSCAVLFETQDIPKSRIFTEESHCPLSMIHWWCRSSWICFKSLFLVSLFNYIQKLVFLKCECYSFLSFSYYTLWYWQVEKPYRCNFTISCCGRNREHRNVSQNLLCTLCQYVLQWCASIVVHFWMQFESGLLLPLSQNQTGGILLRQMTHSDNIEQPMLLDSGYNVVYEY